jgi:fatty-acid desaturase
MLLGGLITWSWAGALSALFWASLVRIFVVHHITWSINSVCHTIGERPFAARDKSSNFWPLAVISFGRVGTTHTTPIPPRLGTGCCVASSTRPRV